VAEVVAHRDRLDQVLVQVEGARDGSRQRRDLERVGEPGAVVVARRRDEDLGLVLEATKGGRVEDAVAVALEGRPERVRLLGALADRAVGARGAGAERRLAAARRQNPFKMRAAGTLRLQAALPRALEIECRGPLWCLIAPRGSF
jgi:hypothetical protein